MSAHVTHVNQNGANLGPTSHGVLMLTDAVKEAEEGRAVWGSSRRHKRKTEEWMPWGGGGVGWGRGKGGGVLTTRRLQPPSKREIKRHMIIKKLQFHRFIKESKETKKRDNLKVLFTFRERHNTLSSSSSPRPLEGAVGGLLQSFHWPSLPACVGECVCV